MGSDVTFFFTQHLGVGGGFQLSGATIKVPSAGGATQNLRVGDPKVGGGMRMRFQHVRGSK